MGQRGLSLSWLKTLKEDDFFLSPKSLYIFIREVNILSDSIPFLDGLASPSFHWKSFGQDPRKSFAQDPRKSFEQDPRKSFAQDP